MLQRKTLHLGIHTVCTVICSSIERGKQRWCSVTNCTVSRKVSHQLLSPLVMMSFYILTKLLFESLIYGHVRYFQDAFRVDFQPNIRDTNGQRSRLNIPKIPGPCLCFFFGSCREAGLHISAKISHYFVLTLQHFSKISFQEKIATARSEAIANEVSAQVGKAINRQELDDRILHRKVRISYPRMHRVTD